MYVCMQPPAVTPYGTQNSTAADGESTPVPNTNRRYTDGHNQYRPYDAVLTTKNGADFC